MVTTSAPPARRQPTSEWAGRRSIVAALRVAAFAVPLLVGIANAAEKQPLHERIDSLLTADYVGPLAAEASDADFLRRASLDLNGIIPSAAECREFFADASPNKRQGLVDRLLASPRWARHMATVFDVMLMERRATKGVQPAEWQKYLIAAFAANKPFDRLASDVLHADPAVEEQKPAANFYLNRDVEANQVTRDIGRLFFGRDMQCAQCHNHPLIEDYLQADYYGLLSFVTRTYLFRDSKRNALLAEKADGETNFKSVFTGFSMDKVLPRVPKGNELLEPVVAKGEEYLVKPDKDTRPVPKVSRRGLLAQSIASGRSDAFNRNIANRLWAHLFGRGLVMPLDYHHPDNPPSNPALMKLLADELAGMKFDVKAFMRELALTRAYQRSCEVPADAALPAADLQKQIGAWEKSLASEQETLAKKQQELEQVSARSSDARKLLADAEGELAKQATARTAAQTELEKAEKAVKSAAEKLAADRQAAALVQAAATATRDAAKKLADDKVLVAAAAQIEARHKALVGEMAAAEKSAKPLQAAVTAAQQKLAAFAGGEKQIAERRAQLAKVDGEQTLARGAVGELKVAVADLTARIQEARQLAAFRELAAAAMKSDADQDRETATRAWNDLTAAWEKRFAWMPLKPLSAESLAMSTLEATGQVAGQSAAIEAEWKKTPPKNVKLDDAPARASALEGALYDRLQGQRTSFVNAFSNGAGQPDDVFQPSVGQALFVSNDNTLQALVAPTSGLVTRLAAMSDNPLVAEDLYLCIYSRLPSEAERDEVVRYLVERSSERPAAIHELAWAMLSSTEFRFNH